jgi:GntR family transcriptional regulator
MATQAPTIDESQQTGEAASAPAFSPLYQQIKSLILQSLQAGHWKPGDLIPSEIELAARFRVSQGTVRKAIDELAAEHLLVRRQGRGTFVATHAEQHVQYRFLRLLPDHGDADSEGPAQRSIIDCKRQRAPADVARTLGLRTGDAVLQVRRLEEKTVPTLREQVWRKAGFRPAMRLRGLMGLHWWLWLPWQACQPSELRHRVC